MMRIFWIALLVCLAGCGADGDAAANKAADTATTAAAEGAASEEVATTSTSTLQMQMPQLPDLADDDIGLLARIHYATHTPDFDRAREFYRQLGYTEGVSGFPLTNTHAMARSLGMFDLCQYELAKGEVMALPGSPNPASIDLLQFKTPFNPDPPYELPNHLGAAYAALATADFDHDVARLDEIGAERLSEPYGEVGERFVFFRDPDGVLYRLIEAEPAQPVQGSDMHIYDMPYVALNVSDLDASLKFYDRLGYAPVGEISEYSGSAAEGRAYGLDGAFQLRTVDIRINRGDKHRLRLSQWLNPVDLDPPYPPPINHIGINRIAVLVSNLDRAEDILKAQDVPFLSEVAPCCTGTGADETGIVHVIDPDGIYVELVGAIQKRGPQPQPDHCPALEIKYPPADS
ncbi:MAG: VOC family protein [Pseudomonadales bacterium]